MNKLEMQQTQLLIALNDFNQDLHSLNDIPLSQLTNKVEELKKRFDEIKYILNIFINNQD